MVRRYVVTIIDVLMILLILNIGYNFYIIKRDYKSISIKTINKSYILDKSYVSYFRDYYDNTDIVGILELNDSDMMSILTKGSDNSYYLNHLVNKSWSYLGNCFVDYRVSFDNSRKIIVYGHNNSKYHTPFNSLINLLDKEYYDNHSCLKLITLDEERYYKIFSVYKTNDDFSYINLYFDNDYEYVKHLIYLKDKSIYDTLVYVDNLDVLILQTCMNDEDENYLVVSAIEWEGGCDLDEGYTF